MACSAVSIGLCLVNLLDTDGALHAGAAYQDSQGCTGSEGPEDL